LRRPLQIQPLVALFRVYYLADFAAKRLIRSEELGTESGDNYQLKGGKGGLGSFFAKATLDIRYYMA